MMEFSKICSLLFIGFFVFGCQKDNVEQTNPAPTSEEIFYTDCGKIPPVIGCIMGVNVFVPNAISVNSNGFNDILFPFAGTGIMEVVSFKIYDDSENLVFENYSFNPNDQTMGWDGKLPNGSFQNGIFNYSITFATFIDEITEFEGAVCVRTSLPVNCVENEQHLAWGTQYDGNGGFDFNLPSYEDCE